MQPDSVRTQDTQLAREVFEAVLNRLPPEVHPPSAR